MINLVSRYLLNSNAPTETFTIDPFAWWPHAASKIVGLGGDVASDDSALVLHSAYHAFEAGMVRFVVTFTDLAATTGTLNIRLNALRPTSSGAANIKSLKIPLAKLARDGGVVRFKTPAEEGLALAVYARIEDDTDASASAVAIEVEGVRALPGPSPKMARAREIFAYDPSEPLLVDVPATLATPRSQMCTADQFDEPIYRESVAQMGKQVHRHRKQWEFVYIARMLEHMGALKSLSRSLGFGCGIEPLPALFASYDIFVTATDLAADDPRSGAWQATDQLGTTLSTFRDEAIVPGHIFDARVEFRTADMTAISPDFRDYDFTWSSCALEHLGSIEAGLEFIERSLDTLRPGGVAVHTTELNLVSDDETIDNSDTVLFRRQDILALARRLTAAGHVVEPITFDIGTNEIDEYVDVPPYTADPHLKLALGRYVTTSFGLAVRKKA